MAGTDAVTQNYLIWDGTGTIQVIPFNLVVPFHTGTTLTTHDDLPTETATDVAGLVATMQFSTKRRKTMVLCTSVLDASGVG